MSDERIRDMLWASRMPEVIDLLDEKDNQAIDLMDALQDAIHSMERMDALLLAGYYNNVEKGDITRAKTVLAKYR